MAAARPLVSIHNGNGSVASQVSIPEVFLAPIRSDIVSRVHSMVNKNHRQPYAVSPVAGEQTSAESWGTGRAVSRIPRVRGGGTQRSGQSAFGNMCRGGRMFNPNRIWRKWHQKVSVANRRFAITSALAASAVPSLVMARGHRIDNLNEVPFVVADASLANVSKTKDAAALLKTLGAYDDIKKADASKKLRAGKGKMRNRRYRRKLGPLIVLGSKTPFARATRNLPGVALCSVRALNILQLAPGGHMGRFVIWTESAFKALDGLYGSESTKKGYTLPRAKMTNPDVDRIIRSEEIQAVIRPQKVVLEPRPKVKRNPLKHSSVREELNPYVRALREQTKQKLSAADRKAKIAAARAAGREARAKRKAFYAMLNQPIGRADQLK